MIRLLVIACFILGLALSIGSVLFIIWKISGFSGLWVVRNVRIFLSVDFSAGFHNVSWGINLAFLSRSLLFFLGSLEDVICL